MPLDKLLLDNLTPEISPDMRKPLISEKIKIFRMVPEKLINNVILPTRWLQISFNPIFSVFSCQELPFGI